MTSANEPSPSLPSGRVVLQAMFGQASSHQLTHPLLAAAIDSVRSGPAPAPLSCRPHRVGGGSRSVSNGR